MSDFIDLSAALPVDTAELEIVVPGTSRRTGWVITIAGPNHPKTVAQNERLARRNLERERSIEMARVNGRKWKGEDKSVDEARRENVEWVVGRIVDWTPVKIAQFSAEPITFSETVAIDLLSQPYMGAFFGQIIDFLSAEASFTPAFATD